MPNTNENLNDAVPSLQIYYSSYLKSVRNVSDSTIRHYLDALKYISKHLRNNSIIENDIFDITDIEKLIQIEQILNSDIDFMELDERGHRMYSIGFKHYLDFAKNENAIIEEGDLSAVDIPIPRSSIVTRTEWSRSSILKNQVLSYAGYKCEIDNNHRSFTAENTRKPYMEGHHAIPIRLQNRIDVSLDIYANIICLCPICHRKIHFGLVEDRKDMIQKIYHDRCERLARCGITISDTDFEDLILNS